LGRAERMRTPSPAASTMVRQRRALAFIGRLLSYDGVGEGGSRPNPLKPAGAPLSPPGSVVSSPDGSSVTDDFAVATKSVSLRRKKRYTT
jgi:hypothetical protein